MSKSSFASGRVVGSDRYAPQSYQVRGDVNAEPQAMPTGVQTNRTFASYQRGAVPDAQPPGSGFPIHSGHRETGGTMRVVGRGEVETISPASSNDAPSGRNPGNPLETGTTPWGSPRAAEALRPTDLITFNGMPMQVQVAERMGLIKRSPAGGYMAGTRSVTDVTSSANPDPNDATTDRPPSDALQDAPAEAFEDANAERLVTAVAERVSPTEQTQAVASIVDSIATTGEIAIPRQLLATIAGQMKVEGSDAEGVIGRMVGAFQAQANRAVSSIVPVDPAEVYAWARENDPKALTEAMQAQAMNRTTEGYRKMALRYLAALGDSDPDSILEADFGPGVSVRKGPKGEPLIRIQGGPELPYREAVRQNLIRVSKGRGR